MINRRKEMIKKIKARNFKLRLLAYAIFIISTLLFLWNFPDKSTPAPAETQKKQWPKKYSVHLLPADRIEWEDVVDVGELIRKANVNYARIINFLSRKYKVDSKLSKALLIVESEVDPDAISGRGAISLMQLMPGTAKEMNVKDPMDLFENIRGGIKYLSILLDKFDTVEEALAAYNKGPTGLVSSMRDGFDPNDYVLYTYVFKIKTVLLYPNL